jgi:hypothetical protein
VTAPGGDVVEAEAVAVDLAGHSGLAQAERCAGAAEVPDRLPALADHLAGPRVAERLEQLAVEGEAALERRDDQVDVVDAARAH